MDPTFTSISNAKPLYAGRTVVLGVSGGIAAYKACEVARLFVKAGADVHVMMTEAATQFIQPLTFQALTGNPVGTSLLDGSNPTAMAHTDLGLKADLVVVAPMTADTMARLAHGRSNDILASTLLVTHCPVLLCPAMNTNMWLNKEVQDNLRILEQDQRYKIMEPASGELACGVVGPGRLPEPEDIFESASTLLRPQDLAGYKVVITGGPTREYIDPVRFISNPATGSLAIELARCASFRGAEVELILGPTHLHPPLNVKVSTVTTAHQMHEAVMQASKKADVVCMSAAVADWKPLEEKQEKEHKSGSSKSLELIRTKDILKELCASANKPTLVLGFAAETLVEEQDLIQAGKEKLERKGCDLLFVNHVFQTERGFGPGRSKGVLLSSDGSHESIGPASKNTIADRLMEAIAVRHSERKARAS
jgi:phosphopantothenoylcysteine decarboxylase/phosphopantothenate--cysteine ligase